MPTVVLANARVLDPRTQSPDILQDLHLEGDRIQGTLPSGAPRPTDSEIIDLNGAWVMPGLVQAHVHLVQALFRGLADDLALLDWLRTRIWPLERAHDFESVYWSARLGLTEMLLGGTTAILDMATVHHTDAVFQAASECGMRAMVGKAMMDRDNEARLGEATDESLQGASDLAARWHGKGRLAYAWAPRFVPSCTERLLTETARLARAGGCLLHTHASENLDEVSLVRAMTGRGNLEYLEDIGFLGPDTVLAHCIHLEAGDVARLKRTGATVAHCPGSNLKLASGIAPIPELLAAGVRCTLGSDGAPCNNRMDMFAEMRLAALVQKPIHGAAALPAAQVFEMATRAGAEALGLEAGRVRDGALADLIVLDPDAIHLLGGGDPIAAVVYAATPAAVKEVWIGGQRVVADGAVCGWDTGETVRGCRSALERVRDRAGL